MTLAALAVTAAYAGWASGTVPFTAPADVAVSLPAAMMAAAYVARLAASTRLRHRIPMAGGVARRQGSHAASASASPPVTATVNVDDRGTVTPWLVLAGVVVAVELASYFHGGPRTLYPTISSSAESLFRQRAVKATALFGWLLGGWYVASR